MTSEGRGFWEGLIPRGGGLKISQTKTERETMKTRMKSGPVASHREWDSLTKKVFHRKTTRRKRVVGQAHRGGGGGGGGGKPSMRKKEMFGGKNAGEKRWVSPHQQLGKPQGGEARKDPHFWGGSFLREEKSAYTLLYKHEHKNQTPNRKLNSWSLKNQIAVTQGGVENMRRRRGKSAGWGPPIPQKSEESNEEISDDSSEDAPLTSIGGTSTK